jgi:hypothetical protein
MEISQAKGRIAVYPLQRRAFSLVIVCERRKREKVEILLVSGKTAPVIEFHRKVVRREQTKTTSCVAPVPPFIVQTMRIRMDELTFSGESLLSRINRRTGFVKCCHSEPPDAFLGV